MFQVLSLETFKILFYISGSSFKILIGTYFFIPTSDNLGFPYLKYFLYRKVFNIYLCMYVIFI